MAGFDNDVVYANNADFSVAGAGSGSATNGLQTNGQLWTGTTIVNAGGTHVNVGKITSPNGTVTIGYSTPNITVDLTGGTGPAIQTLSDDVNATISPNGAGNIQLVGHVNEQGATKFSTIVAGTNLANINPMSSARWIVDPLGFNGTHTSITAANASATSGDTIRILPGTYTENVAGKPGVNYVADPGDEFLPNVTVIGKWTLSSAGTVNISNIRLQTNSDFFLAVTGTAASIVNLENCYLNCTNNTGISFTVTNTSSLVTLQNCEGNVTTTGITLFSFSGTGSLEIDYSNFTNTGSSSTNSTCSAGNLFVAHSEFNTPIAVSSTGVIEAKFCFFNVSTAIPLALTNTSGSDTFESCSIGGGTNSAVSIGAGCVAGIFNSGVNSSNTNAITGSGTLEAPSVSFTGNSFANNVTTIAPIPFGLTKTFSPNLAFGGASVGITYTTQLGKYWLIGSMVFFDINIVLSSKGSSVGNASITNLPFTSANDNHQMTCPIESNITFPAGCTALVGATQANSATVSIQGYGTGTIVIATNTQFANTSILVMSGFYWTN